MLPQIKLVEFRNTHVGDEIFTDSDIILHANGVEALAPSGRISYNDFEKLMLHEPEIAILGTGFKKAVAIDPKIADAAKKNKIELVILPTAHAAKKFQELARSGKKVVAKLHITC